MSNISPKTVAINKEINAQGIPCLIYNQASLFMWWIVIIIILWYYDLSKDPGIGWLQQTVSGQYFWIVHGSCLWVWLVCLNFIQPGLFFIPEPGCVPPPPSPCNFNAIKATAMRLGEYKVCPKLFPLRSAKWTSDVTSCENDHIICYSQPPCWIHHLGYLDKPKTEENRPNWLKICENQWISINMVWKCKSYENKFKFLIKRWKTSKFNLGKKLLSKCC